jgi:hypothetical protein
MLDTGCLILDVGYWMSGFEEAFKKGRSYLAYYALNMEY